jgi:phosphatidylglycerophosphate synthase
MEKLQRLWMTKNKDDEWWSSFVTAPLAIAVNFVVVDWKWLTPNLITFLSFVAAVAASCLIVVGGTVSFCVAAALIHGSHILDCMDGQMARYRGVSSRAGNFFDKITDQLQVVLWFGAVGYAANIQTGNALPIILAFIGVAFYGLRGYIKYVMIYIEMTDDKNYLESFDREASEVAKERPMAAGFGYGITANLRWFAGEQRKVIFFDEGVFIFMLSLALVLNELTLMLWVFAGSQLVHGLVRCLQRGRQLSRNEPARILSVNEK